MAYHEEPQSCVKNSLIGISNYLVSHDEYEFDDKRQSYSSIEGREIARELILEAVAVLRQTEAASPETQWLLEDCAELLLPRKCRA